MAKTGSKSRSCRLCTREVVEGSLFAAQELAAALEAQQQLLTASEAASRGDLGQRELSVFLKIWIHFGPGAPECVPEGPGPSVPVPLDQRMSPSDASALTGTVCC